jgi:hypothetical protein
MTLVAISYEYYPKASLGTNLLINGAESRVRQAFLNMRRIVEAAGSIWQRGDIVEVEGTFFCPMRKTG